MGVLKTMEAISYCESRGRQFNDKGKVLISTLGTDDRGLFQIHEPIWGKKAKELGYDLHTIDGNAQMAKYILEVQGLNAWKPSERCWRPLLNKI